ncbi:hypothetical protein GWK48_10445 [Metallosphaera tengchongensis]|uniref:Uncharacterized protein n=1 Tax=Metallosphaera tengchongensis TaxID=1532350 RepID=A0A6N0NVJ9_9CREN|nr:hypothetical protein [Metallosphaera tengchongensis]QKR00752.1 hypothetical protein GWK48_10445 [Metallosphaera tengchongensis]
MAQIFPNWSSKGKPKAVSKLEKYLAPGESLVWYEVPSYLSRVLALYTIIALLGVLITFYSFSLFATLGPISASSWGALLLGIILLYFGIRLRKGASEGDLYAVTNTRAIHMAKGRIQNEIALSPGLVVAVVDEELRTEGTVRSGGVVVQPGPVGVFGSSGRIRATSKYIRDIAFIYQGSEKLRFSAVKSAKELLAKVASMGFQVKE